VPKWYRDNMTLLVEKLQRAAPGVGILLIACPEAGQTCDGFANAYAGIAREVAAAHHCAFWDLRELVGPRTRHWESIGFMGDSLHYNGLGGTVIAHLLLRQLGFDLNDLRHWPSLVQSPPAARAAITVAHLPALESPAAIPAAMKGQPCYTIWNLDQQAVEIRLAVAGPALAVQAIVNDGRCTAAQPVWKDANFDIYVSKPGSGIVRQFVFRGVSPDGTGKVTAHENGKDQPEPNFPWSMVPRQPSGYEVRALIPLALLKLEDTPTEFYFEAAALTAPGPGAPPTFNRLFGRIADGGAFRDTGQAAFATVK